VRSGPLFFVLLLLLALLPAPAAAQTANGRFFPQTGHNVTDEGGVRFWSEFQRLGGVDALGYPASERFEWEGFAVQVFQRAVLQWRPESRSVAFVNVFDRMHDLGKDDWLLRVRQTPPPRAFDDAGKPWADVVRNHLAVLDGYPALRAKYMGVVGDPIEVNGLPQSDVVDVGNALVVRCQRVVLQQWKVDVPWAKAGEVTVALGGDIAKEAGVLPDRAPLAAVAGPSAPPAGAKTIVLDPGHGGFESGAARAAGPRLLEKDVVLDVGLRLAQRLRAIGHDVRLTREADQQVNRDGRDWNGDGKVDTDDDLQARVLVANAAGADVFVSLHANGGTPSMRGLSTFYCPSCTNAEPSRRLATQLHRSVLAALRPYGAGEFGAGLYDEAGLGKPYGHLFVIGPKTPRVAQVNRAPAQALIEMLFISNAADAALLARDDVRDALAAGLEAGMTAYLAGS
jgi:N-acetylmuramoyl-L-alanine amidase